MADIGAKTSNQTLIGTINKDSLSSRDLRLSNVYWSIENKRFIGMVSGLTTVAFNASVGGTGRTAHLTGTTEGGFDFVRLVVISLDTTNLASGVSANIAPTSRIDNATGASAGSIITPTGSWTTFTWSGAGTFTMPTATSNDLITTLASDWMQVSSINRADITGPGPFYFMCRLAFPASATTVYTRDNTGTTTFDTNALLPNRRWFRTVQTGIDGVATPSLLTSTGENIAFPACVLQFRSRGRSTTYMVAGDSIACGTGSDSGALGYAALSAIAVTTTEYPVSLVNSGRGSQNSANYLASAKALISAVNPHTCSYPVWTPNDGTLTQTILDTQIAQAMDFISHCRANSCLPILLTATPETTDSAAVTLLKQQLQMRLLNMQSAGVIVGDVYAATTDGTLGASGGFTWIAGYNSDATHPNGTGHLAISNKVIVPALNKIIQANS